MAVGTGTGAPPPCRRRSPRRASRVRVNLGKDVPEADVRTALATGDMVVSRTPSFTTGSAVDGPWVRVSTAMADARGAASTATTLTPGR